MFVQQVEKIKVKPWNEEQYIYTGFMTWNDCRVTSVYQSVTESVGTRQSRGRVVRDCRPVSGRDLNMNWSSCFCFLLQPAHFLCGRSGC